MQVHPKTVYKWSEDGKIPHLRINGLLRFKKSEIEAWQDKNKRKILEFYSFLPKFDLSLEKYDKMLLKERSNALGKNSKRWNYGFGTVYTRKTKEGKDRWYLDYIVSGERKRHIVKNAQTRAEAVLVLQEKIAEAFSVAHNSRTKNRRTKFQELADSYINEYAKINKRSWRSDRYRIEAHMKSFFGNMDLEDIDPRSIENYRAERLEMGVTKSTVNREITIMKKMFNLAIDWKLTYENPVTKVKLFSEKDTQKERILTEEEELELLAESPDYLKPILVVALTTGMRRGEILNLRWKQVDMKKRQIRVEETKSGKNRTIPINDVLFKELLQIKQSSGKSVFIFPNPKTEKPYSEVKKSFKKACGRAGIEDLRFHDLRHTFATRLIESGVDIITVRDLLGHFSVRVTQRYTHTNQKQMKNAVQLLAQKALNKAKNADNLSHICHISPQDDLNNRVNSFFSVN